jgi:hypothetical protein
MGSQAKLGSPIELSPGLARVAGPSWGDAVFAFFATLMPSSSQQTSNTTRSILKNREELPGERECVSFCAGSEARIRNAAAQHSS